MDASPGEKNILEWDEDDVQSWLSSLGYPQYESQIKEHNISGDVLCILDPEGFKAIGVSTIGQRLAILKAVYLAKLSHNVPIEPDHYVPPSEAQERQENITVERLYNLVKDQGDRLRTLEEENRQLNDSLQIFLDDYSTLLRVSQSRSEDSPITHQASFKWASYKPARSPTKPDIIESPHPSPQQMQHDINYDRPTNPPFPSSSPERSRIPPPVSEQSPSPNSQQPPPATAPAVPKPQRQESSDNLKSFKVSLDDPTWKVLPAALKKYRINNDNWQNYAMFICYGSTGNRIERCLSYDEKPLLLFQRLKDSKKNPVFMLKHIKDIRSPIAVAQQKHAARKASNAEPSGSASAPAKIASMGHNRTTSRPSKLEVNDLSGTSQAAGLASQAGWPEVISPSTDSKGVDELGMERTSATNGSGSYINGLPSTAGTIQIGGSSVEQSKARGITPITPASDVTVETNSSGHARDTPIVSSGVSYAVAIYPYMAEQEDEFDVVVGDTFVILSRARGWWVVQRDPTGSGVVETDTSKQGWVPAGCLLETNVPVASAIAEANAANASSSSRSVLSSSSNSPPQSPINKTPILPLSIISTSFPGIALMDYVKKGEEELDLLKDDALRVFKRYNHWSYAVKEEGGDRGWVPSWFIGKVANPNATPVTPGPTTVSNSLNTTSVSLDTEPQNANQISPMSSAFPVMQTRTATVA